ncbi:MAG: ABC transporter ATP-binding protein [Symploca sp. SIO3C6]|uniref:ABC transporter ATP-binding protein n=1 Tax=Symploca sp. SIO1C4 TaxID=2607765 RepID=A0A6B3NGB3_9CYAN|nr:ABC transporter ATP-binding protein [Symploca sp. SIO3C6]NER29054.1 ABC transporter ATP-binding protein [Symploca sp. SIO1C4]NET08242.1 ABC transporter ATP-binding protein [Symploca sp. SIO2B6]NET50866.1 ABC transporter ATP-binding protein [Merismopedia sp. SIO2A8]
MKLRVEQVSWGVDGSQIVREVNLEVGEGEFVGLLGPNGSGKSSLLRCIYRVLAPDAGLITLNGKDVWKLSTREMAQRTAVVLQETPTEFDFTVEEMVWMGRAPHKKMFDRETAQDRQIVKEALRRVGLDAFAQRNFLSLSGGEKQRVLVARALAQQARFLVLDEPTNHLDIRYQLEILELVKELGITSIAALHDLNLAAAYCHRLYVLHKGEIVAAGTPELVLCPKLIRTIYGVNAEVQIHPLTGKLHIIFFPKGKNED